MDRRVKLSILADAAKYDASCASSGSKRTGTSTGIGHATGNGICHSYTPDGRCVSLLKILLTNHCIYDCQYCINRITSDVPRARFTVQEIVDLTLEFYRRNYIEGLFLSSGVIQSPDYTMEQLIAVARGLRMTHQYNGYIHLKVVPGASAELIREAGLYADRISANIELPTAADLSRLAPEKKRPVIESAMSQIARDITEYKHESSRSAHVPRFAPAGQSTQMIVGATPSPDSAILRTASELYSRHRMRRVYYSAYSPIQDADARLPARSPPLVREHRLYQADWLMRFYGFRAAELTPAEGNLDLRIDPKLAWALANREFFPVDLNRASRFQLLRIPGIGARTVMRILSVRRHHRITLHDLTKLRVSLHRARPFVITADHNPDHMLLDRTDLAARIAPPHQQLNLFETSAEARTGEL